MTAPSQWRQITEVEGLHAPLGRYVHALIHQGVVYVSGCGPFDADGNLIGDDIVAQSRQTLHNARLVLEAAGSAPWAVIKETVYLLDIEDRFATRIVRDEFYGEHVPASTLIGAGQLVHPDMRIEMDFVARIVTAD